MFNPVATYRIQFHKEFNFIQFENIVSYLQQLGVSTVYASPVFESTMGSTHGYDVLNPNKINPEIGSEEQLKAISNRLNENAIGWLQDIVPNHMAYDTKNAWLLDVLEKGSRSVYASFFDSAWSSTFFKGHIIVPFLGATLDEVIEKGDLKIMFINGRLMFQYFEAFYPMQLRSYATVMQSSTNKMPAAIQKLIGQIKEAELVEDKKDFEKLFTEVKSQLASFNKTAEGKAFLEDCFNTINSDKSLLKMLADDQLYRLCHWQETDHRINYRRFFTVNGLICLNIQDQEVFLQHHALVKKLFDEGIFKGLRIDHIDGLYNPEEYLNHLRTLVGKQAYINVEKILAKNESLPASWPVEGTTGYEFLSMVNNLLTQQKSEQAFTDFYQQLTGDTTPIEKQLYDKKSFILYHHMGGELNNLYEYFMSLNLVTKEDVAHMRTEDIRSAIAEFLIHCPVYRYYGNVMPLDREDATAVKAIFKKIISYREDLTPAVNLLEKVLLQRTINKDEVYRNNALQFYLRCMQLSGPLMAKGVEDTLMYTYNRFIAHNEVGDSPDAFGISAEDFHKRMEDRQARWPLSLNATATHDTKRGEDARARLNVLSELPQLWFNKVKEWQLLNNGLKKDGVPNVNDEYFIYQSLIGAYPLAGDDETGFINRFIEYLQKAFREAKTNSNWTSPNEQYELAIKDFATALLDTEHTFLKSFQQFLKSIASYGIINSLTQVILKFLCPGVPDVYQGCELWDHSFVDPDNRRAVDYSKRQQLLNYIQKEKDRDKLIDDLWHQRENGGIKLWLVQILMHERKLEPDFVEKADYLPLHIKGKYAAHLLAFARVYQEQCTIVIVPLHLAALSKLQGSEELILDWEDTAVVLPPRINNDLKELLTQTSFKCKNELVVKRVFKMLPFAILKTTVNTNTRGAGILMHISSLPSPFGIGDLGPQAKTFALFLKNSHQKYWQLLPVNPIDAGQSYSPYSSISAKAGNTLFISPEMLLKEGLLQKKDMLRYHITNTEKVDYAKAEKVKGELFDIAWNAFVNRKAQHLQKPFEIFCKKEHDWLHNFALYIVIKKHHNGQPWYNWAPPYKNRNIIALKDIEQQNEEEIKRVKWLQFVFADQWQSLKNYCSRLGIKLVGDLPFYVSYDSVDVWTERQIFSLNEEGEITAMAGVPPDVFSEEGQLWGMPLFKWDVLKRQDYTWWIKRLQKNVEHFDLVRLDHFRAFASYWEVPAGEETAKNGVWKKGPGIDFFQSVQKHFGHLPFIAEDLGDITDDVFELRDKVGIPGMKVLQFAFDDQMPVSIHTPQNYNRHAVVYTGTHDNNTIIGWYNTSKKELAQLEKYVGRKITLQKINQELIRMAYASVAATAIIPLQDVLCLGEEARMNTPATGEGNWQWRLLPGQLTAVVEEDLSTLVSIYNRQ